MDIVALAALEQVTLRSRFQACLTELQASQGRLAPPTLMALVRMTSAPLLPVPSLTEAQAFARQATAAASPPAVPRLNLASTAEGAAAPSSGPMSEEYRAEGAEADPLCTHQHPQWPIMAARSRCSVIPTQCIAAVQHCVCP